MICHYSFTPATILLGICYHINTHTSDGQHKYRVAATNAENNGENNNEDANPPPPPLLNLEQVLAMQA
jgi:hypothetical protein